MKRNNNWRELLQYKELREALVRVRDLHTRTEGGSVCHSCDFEYPCPTIKALDGEQ